MERTVLYQCKQGETSLFEQMALENSTRRMKELLGQGVTTREFQGFCVAASCNWLKLRYTDSDYQSPPLSVSKFNFPPKVKDLYDTYGADEEAICQKGLGLYTGGWPNETYPNSPKAFSKMVAAMMKAYKVHDKSWDFLFHMRGSASNPDGHTVGFRWVYSANHYETFDSNLACLKLSGCTLEEAITQLVGPYNKQNLFPNADLHLVSDAPLTKA